MHRPLSEGKIAESAHGLSQTGTDRNDRERPLHSEVPAIQALSERYADQNELDYAALADAAKSGSIEVERDLV
jgi:hypothetical protein